MVRVIPKVKEKNGCQVFDDPARVKINEFFFFGTTKNMEEEQQKSLMNCIYTRRYLVPI